MTDISNSLFIFIEIWHSDVNLMDVETKKKGRIYMFFNEWNVLGSIEYINVLSCTICVKNINFE